MVTVEYTDGLCDIQNIDHMDALVLTTALEDYIESDIASIDGKKRMSVVVDALKDALGIIM